MMKPRKSKRLSKPELRKLKRKAENLGIYPVDIAKQHECFPSAVTNFFNGDATSQPLLRTIQQMIADKETTVDAHKETHFDNQDRLESAR